MFPWPDRQKLRSGRHCELIREVAERSAADLLEQQHDWPQLNVAELRGYARARAAAAVRRHARLAFRESDRSETLSADAVAVAVERTVHLIVREQLLRSQMPVLRRAA